MSEGELIAKARDEFFRENPAILELISLSPYDEESKQYLKNRLERAFIAGWDAVKKQEQNVSTR